MNNENYSKGLLKEPEIETALKDMIYEKAQYYESLLKKADKGFNAGIDQVLYGKIGINTLVGQYEAEMTLPIVERDLANMCYCLKTQKYSTRKNTEWERAYEYATTQARIEDVARLLTGAENLNRNLKCSFHDDSTASLKIYSKTNSFYCFGCNIRGSPIDFVMQHKNCSFREAVLFIFNLT